MVTSSTDHITKDWVLKVLEAVPDPEVPVLSVIELGVVRDVLFEANNITVVITPTYSGCPAMDVFEEDIISELKANGVENVAIKTVYHPAWTTDWMSDVAKEKLRVYGIAPPEKSTTDKGALFTSGEKIVACPRCSSKSTKMISLFGSTACKAHYQCKDCLEPFDYFKCI